MGCVVRRPTGPTRPLRAIRPWLIAGTVAALAAVSGCGGSSAPAKSAAADDDYPGLPHTTVQVSPGGCGTGWTKPQAGLQVFEVSNTGPQPEEAYLKNPATGAVLGTVGSVVGLWWGLRWFDENLK